MDRNRRGAGRERDDDAGAEFQLYERERLRRRGADGAAIAQRDDDSPSPFAGLGMLLSPDILGGNNASAVANTIPEDSLMGDFAGVFGDPRMLLPVLSPASSGGDSEYGHEVGEDLSDNEVASSPVFAPFTPGIEDAYVPATPPRRAPRTNRFNFDDAVVEPLLAAADNREFSVGAVADNEVVDAPVMALPPHAQPAVLASGSNTHSMGNGGLVIDDGFVLSPTVVLPTRAPLFSVTISSSDAAARSAPKITIPNTSPKNPSGGNGLGGGPRSSESGRGGGTA